MSFRSSPRVVAGASVNYDDDAEVDVGDLSRAQRTARVAELHATWSLLNGDERPSTILTDLNSDNHQQLIPYFDKTQLKSICASLQIPYTSATTKPELVDLVTEAVQNATGADDENEDGGEMKHDESESKEGIDGEEDGEGQVVGEQLDSASQSSVVAAAAANAAASAAEAVASVSKFKTEIKQQISGLMSMLQQRLPPPPIASSSTSSSVPLQSSHHVSSVPSTAVTENSLSSARNLIDLLDGSVSANESRSSAGARNYHLSHQKPPSSSSSSSASINHNSHSNNPITSPMSSNLKFDSFPAGAKPSRHKHKKRSISKSESDSTSSGSDTSDDDSFGSRASLGAGVFTGSSKEFIASQVLNRVGLETTLTQYYHSCKDTITSKRLNFELETLARGIDAMRKEGLKPGKSLALEIFVRRFAGLMFADSTGNWAVVSALGVASSGASLLPTSTLSDINKTLRLSRPQTQMVFTSYPSNSIASQYTSPYPYQSSSTYQQPTSSRSYQALPHSSPPALVSTSNYPSQPFESSNGRSQFYSGRGGRGAGTGGYRGNNSNRGGRGFSNNSNDFSFNSQGAPSANHAGGGPGQQ
jgi:hypothetical protein